MSDIDLQGAEWLREQIEGLTDTVERVLPSEYVEKHRYLPASVSPNNPGPMSFDLTPYAREILDCADINSPVREVTVLKGVQVAYTTAVLESIIMYLIGHIKTARTNDIQADCHLAK